MAEDKKIQEDKDFRYLVRIVNTDLDGNKQIAAALRRIKGVSYSFANSICVLSGIDRQRKTGYLNDDEVKRLESNIRNSVSVLPSWMLNRRKDAEDGVDKHLLTTDLDYAIENDIKLMKKIRSYKGIRHGMAAPVRGQRTRSNFRRNKGKVMGVVKSKVGGKTG
ncbi:30S ribosomal protein S13 [Candidatus Woesearchaeota archaeon]|nr:30S ribosomal protein S13 [Candidatus Woesearchaeota archaeon]